MQNYLDNTCNNYDTELNNRREAFLAELAMANWEFPEIVNAYRVIYQLDPQRYYSRAIRSKEYSKKRFSAGTLQEEIELKRMFGVLLAAEEDELLRKKLNQIYYAFDKDFKFILNDPFYWRIDLLRNKKIYSTGLNSKNNAILLFLLYLLLNEYGTTSANEATSVCASLVLGILLMGEESESEKTYSTDETKNPFDYLSVGEYTWKSIKEIKTYKNISDLFINASVLLGFPMQKDSEREHMLDRILRCPEGDPCKEGFYRSMTVISAVGVLGEQFGFSPKNLFGSIGITKAEQMLIMKAFCEYAKVVKEAGVKEGVKGLTCPEINLDMYVSVLIIYFLLKIIADSKKYYFDNNNETVFSQIAYLKEENERVNADILIRDETITKLSSLVEDLRGENKVIEVDNAKGTSNIVKGHLAEVSELKKQIRALKNEIEERKKNEAELFALREFAFSAQSEYVSPKNEIDVLKLIATRKLVIIGGHINWRNKFKKKYPSVVLVDGHLESFDFGILKTADFVLMNVSNMSHTVYYKAMNVLRNGNVPFDYLGRTINQELYENEIADILLKYDMKLSQKR